MKKKTYISKALNAYNIGKAIVSLETSPLGGERNDMMLYKANVAFEKLSDREQFIVGDMISRKIEAYNTPNEDGFSAYDMDQAILRASGC